MEECRTIDQRRIDEERREKINKKWKCELLLFNKVFCGLYTCICAHIQAKNPTQIIALMHPLPPSPKARPTRSRILFLHSWPFIAIRYKWFSFTHVQAMFEGPVGLQQELSVDKPALFLSHFYTIKNICAIIFYVKTLFFISSNL